MKTIRYDPAKLTQAEALGGYLDAAIVSHAGEPAPSAIAPRVVALDFATNPVRERALRRWRFTRRHGRAIERAARN